MSEQNSKLSFLNQVKEDAASVFSSARELLGISASNKNNYRVLKERTPAKKGIIQNNFSENTLQNFGSTSIIDVLKFYKNNNLEITANEYPPVVINKLIKDLILIIKNEVRSLKSNINNTNSIRLNNLLKENFMKGYLESKKQNYTSPILTELILQAEKLLEIQKHQIESLKFIVQNNSNKSLNGKPKVNNNNSLTRTNSISSVNSINSRESLL